MPGTGTLRRSSASGPEKAIVGKSRVAATRLQRGGGPRPGRLDQNAATGILVRSIWHLGGIFAPMPVE